MKGKNVEDVGVGDRFVCIVSKGEPNAIPGQSPGSRYFMRVVAVHASRWYFKFSCSVEDRNKNDLAKQSIVTFKRGSRVLTDAIGVHTTSICENPWMEWDEELDESVPYDIAKGEKHWFLFETEESGVDDESN